MTTQNEFFPKPETQVIIVPYFHLANIVETYLHHVGAVDKDRKITFVGIPVRVDEELNITIEIGFDPTN